jgi:hypothetical protein
VYILNKGSLESGAVTVKKEKGVDAIGAVKQF